MLDGKKMRNNNENSSNGYQQQPREPEDSLSCFNVTFTSSTTIPHRPLSIPLFRPCRSSSPVPNPIFHHTVHALQSTRILTCLSFSSIKARYPSSTTLSILIFEVIIFSGLRLPSS